tara:strand:+ start:650 stop:775 length:126 start_codon:yes stop_codon:yes gene_type:complete
MENKPIAKRITKFLPVMKKNFGEKIDLSGIDTLLRENSPGM